MTGQKVYIRPGECYNQVIAYGCSSDHVGAGISSESRTELVVTENGTLTACQCNPK